MMAGIPHHGSAKTLVNLTATTVVRTGVDHHLPTGHMAR
jgi:hypothetical protein